MPALRKRLSRTSTPLNPDSATPPSTSQREKHQSSIDGWVEPAPQNPTASFEEHGFARHGVLETMAPLGQPPSAKVKAKARAFGEPYAKRTFFGKNGNLTAGDEAVSTPEMTPAPEPEPERERDDSEKEDVYPGMDADQDEEEEDDDYIPGKGKGAKGVGKGVMKKTVAKKYTPVKNGVTKSTTPARKNSVASQTAPSSAVLANTNPAAMAKQQRIHIAVLDAMDRANQGGHGPHLAQALNQLFRDSQADGRLGTALDGVLSNQGSSEDQSLFRTYMKAKKKQFKREAKRQQSPAYPLSQVATKPAPTTSSTKTTTSAANAGIAGPDDSPAPADLTAGQASAVANPAASSSSLTPHPLATVPALSVKVSPSPSATRVPSKTPDQVRTPNGDTASALEQSTKAPSPGPGSPGSAALGSDSDLSDVNEEIVQNGPPPPVQANGNGTASAPKQAKVAALARQGKKSRANSAKPPGKNEQKSADDLAEIKALQLKRDTMLKRFDDPTTVSETRFEVTNSDDMLETESLTSSQAAVGPPTDIRTRRTSRRNDGLSIHAPGKRPREEDVSELYSPQLDSAAATRPSTPAIAPPFAKRVKLTNGNTARTKRSPVKNREGPIAGIAHTGGGGLRPLGPDDNEPGSPPEAWNEHCSACKGTGEFVCCETCPRVFHFLCLDPPRVDPPPYDFYCLECSSRNKAGNENADTYIRFGPLFKSIETTNVRAFALPEDIRNYFEGVSMKEDGSYFEAVKKFPLSKNSGYGYQKPDYLKEFDNKKAVLCTSCGKSSGGKRQMLQCDFCHEYWHLDCCDPPLANPPFIGLESSTRDAWKCPRHIDHDLRSGQLLPRDLNSPEDEDVEMQDATPVAPVPRKIRKPKAASIVEPVFHRGTRNSGLIEIINDSDDETDGEGNYVFGPTQPELDESRDLNNKVFRVPEKGILLDFISKVKNSNIEKRKEQRNAAKLAAKRKASFATLSARPFAQQQAALHLTQLANKESDIGLNEVSVESLVLHLTAEAPKPVVDEISKQGPGPLTPERRAQLLKLKELLDRALEG